MRPKPKVKSFEISKRLVYRGVGEGPGQRWGAGRGRGQHRPSSQRRRGTTSTGCGTGCPRGAISRGRCGRWRYRRIMGRGSGSSGVPNTADRVAQTAAAMLLEEKLEPIFHPGQLRLPSGAQCP